MIFYRKNFYARFRLQWADVFTDAAAIAQVIHYVRFLDGSGRSVHCHDRDISGTDGLFRNRTVLFTDDAVSPAGKGETMIPVKDGFADNLPPFCFNWQAGDGTGGTDLAAEGAVVFAIAEAGNDQRGVDTFNSGLIGCRVEGVFQAYFHAFAAADTFSQEVVLTPDAGGAQETALLFRSAKTGGECQKKTTGHGAQQQSTLRYMGKRAARF